jgi:cytochrome c-type biogenesis protein CcmH
MNFITSHAWRTGRDRALGLALCLAVSSFSVQAKEAPPTAQDPVVESRMVKISEELRCLVCQNESLASSHAELAGDLREEVRDLIRQNKTDAEVKDYLVTRYGDFVLYRPDIKPMTWVLWFGPFALLLSAAVVLVMYLRQRQSAAPAQALTDADRQRAEKLLKDGESE